MKERPILFSSPMVRAILDGRKTQTRRVVKGITNADLFEPLGDDGGFLHSSKCTSFCDFACGGHEIACPYGVPGDRLVMLCGWATEKRYNKTPPRKLPKTAKVWSYFDGETKPAWCGRTRMGRHMPKWLRERMPRADVTCVRVQRLQAISEADAIAEGCEMDGAFPKEQPHVSGGMVGWDDAREWYADLWDSINGDGSWNTNPWVWVVDFRRVEA